MPLFKKKPDTLIPPVVASVSSLPSATRPRSSPNTYPNTSTVSRDNAPNYGSDLQPYNRNKGADVYTRDTADLDKDRNELFSGYNPTKSGSGRFFDGPDVRNNGEGEGDDEDNDVERIKQQTRFVKQESVNSTRNALRLAREAEETGRNTLERLGEQAGKLKETERYLDTANAHSNRAADNTSQLKKLNRSIFLPVIHRNKKYEVPEVPDQVPDQANYRRKDPGDFLVSDNSLVGGRKRTDQRSREQYKRYQFENTASDDDMEDEMSDNLDELSAATGRLKALGEEMGDELDRQNVVIEGITGKTDHLDGKLRVNTDRLKKIK